VAPSSVAAGSRSIQTLIRTLATLAEAPSPESARLWAHLDREAPEAAAHTDLFVLQLPPFASIYLGDDAMLGGAVRERIVDFWNVVGATPPEDADHLAALLGLYAALSEEGTPAAHARHSLLYEHVLSWVPMYLTKLREIASPAYRAWAGLLHETLMHEAGALPAFERLPLHLREASALADPRTAPSDAFTREVLVPARTGMLIVRDDLARAAHGTGLGLRAGERRFALDALVGQDQGKTLAWLRDEARAWVEKHRSETLFPIYVRNWWLARAEATVALLEELSMEAQSR
jgi:TorA maturation chaperone TorD